MDSTSRINITKSFSVKHENTMRKCNSKDSKQSVTLNKIFSLPFLSKSYIITHITSTAFQLLYLYITNQEYRVQPLSDEEINIVLSDEFRIKKIEFMNDKIKSKK